MTIKVFVIDNLINQLIEWDIRINNIVNCDTLMHDIIQFYTTYKIITLLHVMHYINIEIPQTLTYTFK